MKTPRSPIFDVLAIDGGWLTTAGIALACGMIESSVDRSLWRWAAAGIVERRTVPQTTHKDRNEWRAVSVTPSR